MSSLVCLPLLTVSVAYENFLLYISCRTDEISAGAVGTGYVFQAMIIPLMMIVLHEVTYRLHEYRNVHFLWFPLEVDGENDGAEVILWINRLFAITFFILGLAVAFEWWGLNNQDPLYVGSDMPICKETQPVQPCGSLYCLVSGCVLWPCLWAHSCTNTGYMWP